MLDGKTDNVVNIETAITDKYNPQWIMNNRPSDEGIEIIAWLESLGLQEHLARRCYDNFIRACMAQLFDGIELVFQPALKAVKN